MNPKAQPNLSDIVKGVKSTVEQKSGVFNTSHSNYNVPGSTTGGILPVSPISTGAQNPLTTFQNNVNKPAAPLPAYKPPTDPFLESHPNLRAISDFTGTTKLGKGISQSLFLNFTKNGKDILQQYNDGKISEEDFNKIIGGPIATNKEVLGSAANTAANIALFGEGNAVLNTAKNITKLGPAAALIKDLEMAGKFVTGSTKLADVAGKLGIDTIGLSPVKTALQTGFKESASRVLSSLGKNAIGGAVLGTTQGFADNKSAGQAVLDGLETGAISGALAGVGSTFLEGLRSVTGRTVTEKLYNSGIGMDKKSVQAGRSPAANMIKEGIVGTAHGIYSKVQQKIDEVAPKIDHLLQFKYADKKVSTDKVFESIANGINENVMNDAGDVLSSTEIKQIVQDAIPQVKTLLSKPELTLRETNRLRQILDRTLGDTAFKNANLPFKKDATMDFTNGLRKLVQTEAPDTAPLFKEYSTSVQAAKALENEMSKQHVLRHMVSLVAATSGGHVGMGTAAALEAASSTIGQTGAAVGLDRINRGIVKSDNSITAEIIKKFTNLGLQNFLK